MKNEIASIQTRLKNLSRESGMDFVLILRLYMQEGLLRRLSRSKYYNSFYLKGGLLLFSISGFASRPTQDIDLLGVSIPNDNDHLRRIMLEILSMEAHDGLTFKTESIQFIDIREGARYQGKRMRVSCYLGNMRTVLKLDVGFGDVIYPEPVEMDYPQLLKKNGIRIYAYSLESVIAEKFETMILLDALNSRMKDFYDVYKILTENHFSEESLMEAIKRTFQARGTVCPEHPAIFSKTFAETPRNHDLWKAFLRRIAAEHTTFEVVIMEIKNNLEPIYKALNQKL